MRGMMLTQVTLIILVKVLMIVKKLRTPRKTAR